MTPAPRKIVIATDFSSSGDRASEVAIEWAVRSGAELHWVHGVEHLTEATPTSAWPLLQAHVGRARLRASQMLDEWAGRARERGLESSAQCVDAPAARGVVEVMEKVGADCAIVGSHGHTGIRRALLGSVAEHIVRNAPCRVLVVRGEVSPLSPGRILLGDDLAPESGPARSEAIELARELHVGLEVVHALDPGIPYLSALEVVLPGTLVDEIREEARTRMAEVARDEASGLEIENVVASERPADALCDRAEQTGAGLVVVGSHNRQGAERVLLGSVAERVVRHAPCSVLVVR